MTIGIITQMRRKIQHELQRMKKVKACHDFEAFAKECDKVMIKARVN